MMNHCKKSNWRLKLSNSFPSTNSVSESGIHVLYLDKRNCLLNLDEKEGKREKNKEISTST